MQLHILFNNPTIHTLKLTCINHFIYIINFTNYWSRQCILVILEEGILMHHPILYSVFSLGKFDIPLFLIRRIKYVPFVVELFKKINHMICTKLLFFVFNHKQSYQITTLYNKRAFIYFQILFFTAAVVIFLLKIPFLQIFDFLVFETDPFYFCFI